MFCVVESVWWLLWYGNAAVLLCWFLRKYDMDEDEVVLVESAGCQKCKRE